MNTELICKTALEINNSWVNLLYFKDTTTVVFLLFFLFILYKIIKEATKNSI